MFVVFSTTLKNYIHEKVKRRHGTDENYSSKHEREKQHMVIMFIYLFNYANLQWIRKDEEHQTNILNNYDRWTKQGWIKLLTLIVNI